MSAVFDFRYLSVPRGQQPRRLDGLSQYDLKELDWVTGRRAQVMWLAGRMLAKQLILQQLETLGETRIAASDISVLSRDEHGQPMRPQIWVHHHRLHRSLSIAHTDHGVLVALARTEACRVGVDLALPARATPGPFDNWFTPTERQWLDEQEDPSSFAQLWAIKQAFYKVANRGERFVPRHFEVAFYGPGHIECTYSGHLQQLRPQVIINQYDAHVAAIVLLQPSAARSDTVALQGDFVVPQWQVLRLAHPRP